MEITFTFFTMASALGKLFILMLVGYMLYRFGHIDDKFNDILSQLLVNILFPALIISTTITHFSFSSYAYWWFLPLSAIIFSLVGVFMGKAACAFLPGFNFKKEFISSCGFQNCGYLPMNLILFAFSDVVSERLFIYMFLFVLGFNILMWSFVPLYLSGRMRDALKISVLLNPPVVATIFSMLWVFFWGKGSMPSVLMDPIRELGKAAFPLAMLTMGAYLCKYRSHRPDNKLALAVSGAIKLVLFPMLVLAVLKFISIETDYKFFLFLESIMPTAVSLVVIGSYTGVNNKFFSDNIFYTHLAAFFTIPIWLVIFKAVIH